MREPGEQRDVAAERQPLVADLGGGGEDDVADPLGRERRVAPQQLADDLDRHVVGAGLREQPVRARLAERRADAVDVDDLAQGARHAARRIASRPLLIDIGRSTRAPGADRQLQFTCAYAAPEPV